jgi:hypothetical protein
VSKVRDLDARNYFGQTVTGCDKERISVFVTMCTAVDVARVGARGTLTKKEVLYLS